MVGVLLSVSLLVTSRFMCMYLKYWSVFHYWLLIGLFVSGWCVGKCFITGYFLVYMYDSIYHFLHRSVMDVLTRK